MATYPFLSDEWLQAARAIREEYRGKTQPMAHQVRMNQVITDVPFGDGTINAHMDTSSGEIKMDLGHLDDPDLTVTLDYDTAKASQTWRFPAFFHGLLANGVYGPPSPYEAWFVNAAMDDDAFAIIEAALPVAAAAAGEATR